MLHPETATLRELRRIAVCDALARHNGRRDRSARELQVGIRSLHNWIHSYTDRPGRNPRLAVPPLPQTLLDLAARQTEPEQELAATEIPDAGCSLVPDYSPIARQVELQLLALLGDLCRRQPVDLERRLRQVLALLQQVRRAAQPGEAFGSRRGGLSGLAGGS